MLSVEDWAEIRRLHRAEGLPIKAIVRVLGISSVDRHAIPPGCSIRSNTSKLLLAIGALPHESNRESSEPVYEVHERLPHRPGGGIT